MKNLIALIALLICLPLSAVGQRPDASRRNAQSGDVQNVIFFGEKYPTFIRVHLQVDGTGIRELREAYARRLIRSLDKDQNGFLGEEEARNVPAFGQFADESGTLNDGWAKIDRDPRDGKVSSRELSDFVNNALGSPFAIQAKPRRMSQSVNLLAKLDANHDGRLSNQEIRNGTIALRKLDLDDDETLSVVELQPFQNQLGPQIENEPDPDTADLPFAAVPPKQVEGIVPGLIKRYDMAKGEDKDGHLSREEIGLAAETFSKFDDDSDGRLNKQELSQFLLAPMPHVQLLVQLPSRKRGRPKISKLKGAANRPGRGIPEAVSKLTIPIGGVAVELRARSSRLAMYDNRQLYKLEFLKADQDKNKYLDEQEFGSANLPRAGFKVVDRNGDGQLFVEELMAYVDQTAIISTSRIVMTVAWEGKSLFEILDANFDRRLSLREFNEAFSRLRSFDRDRDGTLAATELVGRYKVAFEMGKPSLLQLATIMRAGGSGAPRLSESVSGPVWFRKMDRNRDGDVSLREFLGSRELFQKLDTDRDGLLSLDESVKAQSSKAD